MIDGGEFPEDLFEVDERTGRRTKPNRARFVRYLSEMEGRVYVAPSDTFGERGFELFTYDRGCYRDTAVAYIHSRIEEVFKANGLTSNHGFSQETTRSLVRRSLKPRSSFNPPGYINLENGTYDIATGELRSHSPSHRFTWQLPIKFDPAATAPTFLRFLAEVLPPEPVRREIQKLFGYCIGVDGHPFQCAHMFVGEGNNGKSSLSSVLIELLGRENVSAETLQSLTENRFAPASLYGKRANIFSDLPSNPLRYTSVFKALTGGDKVRAELKFGKTFYFVNQAKLVFSANELPEVNDRTRAFWRRWYLINFEQDFTGREDRGLSAKLLLELPGILNWGLAGIPLLEQDGGFLSKLGADDLKSEWRRRSDTLAWFVAEMVETDPLERVAKQDFYEAYAEFCARNKATPKRPDRIGEELPRHIPSVRTEQGRPSPGAPPIRYWRGAYLRAGVGVPASPASPATGQAQARPPGGVEAGEAGEAGGPTPVPEIHKTEAPVMEEPGNWTVAPKDRERPKGVEP